MLPPVHEGSLQTHTGMLATRSLLAVPANDSKWEACESSSSGGTGNVFIGIILSVVADTIIPLSLCLQKWVHNKNEALGKLKVPYYKLKWWWVGNLLMLGGEIMNLTAYGYAPASVVAPIGGVGIPLNAVFSSIILKESFSWRDGVGTTIAISGCVVIVVFVPDCSEQLDYLRVIELLREPTFVFYACAMAAGMLFLYTMTFSRGLRHPLWFVSVCALVGSISVMMAKAVSSMLVRSFEGNLQIDKFVFWAVLLSMGVSGFGQVKYLNRAMKYFDNQIVIPTYYVFFTLMSVIGANVLYKEFYILAAGGIERIIWIVGGVCCTFLGIGIMTMRKVKVKKRVEASQSPRKEPLPDIPESPKAPNTPL